LKLQLFIFGTGSHARKVFHYAIGCGHCVVGFVDENPTAQSPVRGFGVIPVTSLPAPADGIAIFVAIGRADVRKRLMDELGRAGWNCPALVHTSAWVAPDVCLEAGVLIGAGAVVETASLICRGVIVDIGVLVDHECVVGAFSHLKPGAVLGPCTKIPSPLGQT